jgi:hypothetical protein
LRENQRQTDCGQSDDLNDDHLRFGKSGGSGNWRLNGFRHPAKHVAVPQTGQEDNAATVPKPVAFQS